MLDHLEQARVCPEEVLPEISAALDEIFLILAVGDFAHAPDQQAFTVVLNQAVPIGAPNNFDDVPACAPENGLQFLDDLSIAADRAVQTLQIAVDYKSQVVEPLARRQCNRAQRFRLVHLTIAEESPNPSPSTFLETAILQILDEAGVINRLDRSQSHRDCRKFPEILHQPGVRVRGKPSARLQLAPEVFQLLLRNATFEVSARIDSRRRVSLKIDDVPI